MENKWVAIALKAYEQAVEYEKVSGKHRTDLFNFIHDWFRIVEDENRAIESGEETPSEMFTRVAKRPFTSGNITTEVFYG